METLCGATSRAIARRWLRPCSGSARSLIRATGLQIPIAVQSRMPSRATSRRSLGIGMDANPPKRERSSVDIVDLLKYIGSPIAVGAALLFYFGWVRSNQQAALYGADISVFEMSPEDLILRKRERRLLGSPGTPPGAAVPACTSLASKSRASRRRGSCSFHGFSIPIGLILIPISPYAGTMPSPDLRIGCYRRDGLRSSDCGATPGAKTLRPWSRMSWSVDC